MTVDEVVELVRRTIGTELEIDYDSIKEEDSLRHCYGLDSVATANVIFALEGALDAEIDPKDFVDVDSLKDVRELVSRYLAP